MDKLSAMTTFVRIVDAGSLTGAAATLDVSLPTVVRTLAALERDLGVSLLERTTRRIRLTDEGAHYLDRCRAILSAVQETEEALVSRRSEPAGKLTVTASALFGRRYVGPIVCDFVQRHPKVTAELLFVDRVVNMVEEGIDVGVRIAALKDSTMVAVPVGQTRRVVCASERYLRKHGAPKTLQDLARHDCIRHSGLSPRSEWSFRVGGRPVTVPIRTVMLCNDIDTAMNACLESLGLGMFLSYMVAPNRTKGELSYVLEPFETVPTAVQIVYPQTKLLSTRTRTFIDDCAGQLRRIRFD
jgi:DNA-binding transcriptional LysR family regulator